MHRYCSNMQGALFSFEKMRDSAEEMGDFHREIEAYYQAGLTLKQMQDYTNAAKSFKRMLQVAWYYGRVPKEMLAYEMLSRVYFYLGNVEKAQYYSTRAIQGLAETQTSRTRLLAIVKYRSRMEISEEEFLFRNVKDDDVQRRYKHVLPFSKMRATLDANIKTLVKFHMKLKNTFYRLEQESIGSYHSSVEYMAIEKNKTQTLKEKAKLHYLQEAVDFKLDITTSIRRKGTPIHKIAINDMPSPTADANHTNPLPHTYRKLKAKRSAADPDEWECEADHIKVIQVGIPPQHNRATHDYLQGFQDESNYQQMRLKKFKEETKVNKKVIVNMKELIN
jgi:tetratricopeptide (TPR) repeat protein